MRATGAGGDGGVAVSLRSSGLALLDIIGGKSLQRGRGYSEGSRSSYSSGARGETTSETPNEPHNDSSGKFMAESDGFSHIY